MATLSTLPNEIISLITSHFDRPLDLLHLSLTSRRLCDFTRLDGWKALLKGRFHITGLDTDARTSVHGLTTLYRNWNRKGFVARYLEPSVETTSLNSWEPETWRGPRGQTMGYQPCIDSYEETFGTWGERREVLVWSAGTQVVMRVKETGDGLGKRSCSGDDKTRTVDSFGHSNSWFTYKIPDSSEGRDDITSLRLLRPHQKEEGKEVVVFGTASGQLTRLDINPERAETIEQHFDTLGRAVGAISISSSSSPMLAATLGDTSLALYPPLDGETSDTPIEALSHVTPIIQGARSGRIWSCNFLSPDKVAIGIGPTSEPIQVYKITADGFLPTPHRSFTLGTTRSSQTSIYPLLPVPARTQGSSEAGNVFLSGGYDGIVRLHDVRSPRDVASLYWDPTNDSPIYSLAAQGQERIVVGVSMHSMLKVFDLRLSGSNTYHSLPLSRSPLPAAALRKPPRPRGVQDYATNAIVSATTTSGRTTAICGGWNLYLNPRQPPKRDAYRTDYWRGREDSPVYSLSIPSATSVNLYAGLEGSVQNLVFHGIADKHLDTLLSRTVSR
ncbi:hypothetical protein N0V94_007171, partial [Neodidymelliopsis sp. IMI 364377]